MNSAVQCRREGPQGATAINASALDAISPSLTACDAARVCRCCRIFSARSSESSSTDCFPFERGWITEARKFDYCRLRDSPGVFEISLTETEQGWCGIHEGKLLPLDDRSLWR